MKKKKRKNKLILIFCSMFIAVMSIFAFIPFTEDKQVVSADTTINTYTYSGSNLYLPVTIKYGNGNIDVGNFGPFSVKFGFGSSSEYNKVSDISITFMTKDNYWSKNFYRRGSLTDFSVRSDLDVDLYTYNGNQYYVSFTNVFRDADGNVNTECILGAPVKFILGSSSSGTNSNVFYNLEYYDKDGNSLVFAWTLQAANIQELDYLLMNRQYYLINPYVDFTDNDFYNSGYSAGYEQGYKKGENTGVSTGYANGYKVGKTEGKNEGYLEGIENANDYSFISLMSAVVDAPIKAFTGLFNFEILGVNLSGFFLGLLTCCIVITIVRLLL